MKHILMFLLYFIFCCYVLFYNFRFNSLVSKKFIISQLSVGTRILVSSYAYWSIDRKVLQTDQFCLVSFEYNWWSNDWIDFRGRCPNLTIVYEVTVYWLIVSFSPTSRTSAASMYLRTYYATVLLSAHRTHRRVSPSIIVLAGKYKTIYHALYNRVFYF